MHRERETERQMTKEIEDGAKWYNNFYRLNENNMPMNRRRERYINYNDERDCDDVNSSACSRRLKRAAKMVKSGVGNVGSKLYTGSTKLASILYDTAYPPKHYEDRYWGEGLMRKKRTKRIKKRTKRIKKRTKRRPKMSKRRRRPKMSKRRRRPKMSKKRRRTKRIKRRRKR